MAKVLVVEDSSDIRDLAHLHLTTEGFNVVLAANGQEGLYLAGAEHPDLIITDIDMPVLTGIEMIEQLRTQEESHDIPILVLTAFGKEAMGDSIRAGANRAIMKPAPLDRLITEVRELLAAADKKGFHMH